MTYNKSISNEKIRAISSKLTQITKEETQRYDLLGQPFGETGREEWSGLEHCVYLGLQHCQDFEKKAKYYVERKVEDLKSEDPRRSIVAALSMHNSGKKFTCIDFYGDKQRSRNGN